MKIFKRILTLFVVAFILMQLPYSCAQRGRPTGGPKDTIPPAFVNGSPPNYSTNFDKEEIRINFDEYIKLEEADKQILISPPMDPNPIIEPQGLAQKYANIEFLDTLEPNTTYTINFGRSIVDNNEGNELPFFKYVFSTGEEIDSLGVSGKVKDAYNRETSESISVMLYKLDSTYNDSIIYKKPPAYIAYSKDTTHTFEIENAAAGDYKIVAIDDENQNYLFDQKNEKIGFLTDTVHLPTDEEFDLTIFKEIRDYKVEKPEQKTEHHILFGFQGNIDSVDIKMLTDQPSDFEYFYYKEPKKDTLNYWFKPSFEVDSLELEVRKGEQIDTLQIFPKEEIERDSLVVSANHNSNLPLHEKLELTSNIPLQNVNTDSISIRNKDSVALKFSADLKKEENKIVFDFKKKPEDKYALELLPGSLTDFLGNKNDSLSYNLKTKPEMEYADVRLQFSSIKSYPVIVQLVDENGKTKREMIHQEEDGRKFHFKYVDPGNYYVRLIYDENNNGKWDTGNYLKKEQPEEVEYMKDPIDVRKNWDIVQDY